MYIDYVSGRLPAHLSSASASHRMSTSPFVCHFCITEDLYQSTCLTLLHFKGCLSVHLSATAASHRMSISLLARHFCIKQDVYSSFVCHFCIKQDVYQTICLPLLYHTRSQSVHLTSTSVSHSMSTCPFDLHYICISQDDYLSFWPPPHLYLTRCLRVHFTSTSVSHRMPTFPFVRHPNLYLTRCLCVHFTSTSVSHRMPVLSFWPQILLWDLVASGRSSNNITSGHYES